jgi:peptidoglycan/LPS O-acetylase OafA/YrhL
MNSGTSDFLNASRWVAAFFVVIGHVYNISVNYRGVVHPSLLVRGMHFFSGFGHIAVIVFCDKWISRWGSNNFEPPR